MQEDESGNKGKGEVKYRGVRKRPWGSLQRRFGIRGDEYNYSDQLSSSSTGGQVVKEVIELEYLVNSLLEELLGADDDDQQ
ncbi:hypothetical protein K7X08_006036 [Anisodus acutangulus]|uniref:Uncharacterized protein n=1 Tax=Anisodus acutangulus TaxID=402998 RepID=A0A9Q1R5J1_9SOLA|nr:hypothetical protein K7X08_006036 [Anisodus acutangulus]